MKLNLSSSTLRNHGWELEDDEVRFEVAILGRTWNIETINPTASIGRGRQD